MKKKKFLISVVLYQEFADGSNIIHNYLHTVKAENEGIALSKVLEYSNIQSNLNSGCKLGCTMTYSQEELERDFKILK